MRWPVILGAALLLGACAREPVRIAPPLVPHPAGFVRASTLAPTAPQARPEATWWTELGDEQLSQLIEQGLRTAPSLAAAEARLRQARAGVAAARAGAMPTLGTQALYAHAKLPNGALGGTNGSLDLYDAGFDAQWELDLWGGKRREADKARAEAGAAAARLADTKVMLAAEIARTYVSLRGQEAQAVLAARRETIDARLADMARARFAAGVAARGPVEQAQARLAATSSDRVGIAAEATVLRDALAVLTGNAPGALTGNAPGALDGLPAGAIPLPPREIAVGDPAALLARRPDLRMAEARLAAAQAQIGIDEARRYPQVTFTGMLGIGGASPADLFDFAQVSTIALPRLTWNVLDFGRGAAAVRGAKAGRDAALADYRAAVLGALQDAEAALARFGAARAAAAGAGEQLRHARAAAGLEQARADGGTIAQAQALTAERAALAAEAGESNARAGLTLAYVALAKALGLGWE